MRRIGIPRRFCLLDLGDRVRRGFLCLAGARLLGSFSDGFSLSHNFRFASESLLVHGRFDFNLRSDCNNRGRLLYLQSDRNGRGRPLGWMGATSAPRMLL